MRADKPFFDVTKAIHNGLQGGERPLSKRKRDEYLAVSERNAALLEEQYDVVVVHDPQPAAILSLRGKQDARWIWRCHIDTSRPNRSVWEFIRQFLSDYDAAVFTMREFLPPDLSLPRVEVIPPAIDPLSPKNIELSYEMAARVLDWIGIEPDRPLVTLP